MKESINYPGRQLPESWDEYVSIQRPTHMFCVDCKKPFSLFNTHTAAGWRETQISGMCEKCFDEMYEEPEVSHG